MVDYNGYCGGRFNWVNSSGDARALVDPAVAGAAAAAAAAGSGSGSGSGNALPRHLGFTQPCGCPTSPLDITLTDGALAAGKRYRLSLYFVDFAPSPTCSTLDGTARSQEVYLLTGYPDLSPATERQFLRDFSGGVWWSYNVVGNIRVRISTVRGDGGLACAILCAVLR